MVSSALTAEHEEAASLIDIHGVIDDSHGRTLIDRSLSTTFVTRDDRLPNPKGVSISVHLERASSCALKAAFFVPTQKVALSHKRQRDRRYPP